MPSIYRPPLCALILGSVIFSSPAKADDAVKALQDSIKGKHFVLMNYAADREAHFQLHGEELQATAPRLHAFADFVPEKFQLKGNQLRIEGGSHVFVHNPKSGGLGLTEPLRRALLVIDLDGPLTETISSKLPALLFFPSLAAAFQALPQDMQKLVLPGPQDKRGRSAVDPQVHPPKLLSAADPEFSDEARFSKISGSCEYQLHLDERGHIDSVWLTRPIGYGLDENGEKAIESYKFQPATKDGVPVATTIYVNVNFQIR